MTTIWRVSPPAARSGVVNALWLALKEDADA
jgi:predicted outer membrane lipoprotein